MVLVHGLRAPRRVHQRCDNRIAGRNNLGATHRPDKPSNTVLVEGRTAHIKVDFQGNLSQRN